MAFVVLFTDIDNHNAFQRKFFYPDLKKIRVPVSEALSHFIYFAWKICEHDSIANSRTGIGRDSSAYGLALPVVILFITGSLAAILHDTFKH